MKINIKNAIIVVLSIIAVRGLIPNSSPKPIPTIITKYDTVQVIDTEWVTKLKHDTVYKTNIVEKVIASKPETVLVTPDLVGITALQAGKKPGDTTDVYGFQIADSGKVLSHWQYQFYSTGPLKSVSMAGQKPAMDFYDPPRACHEVRAFGYGAAAITGLRLILGR